MAAGGELFTIISGADAQAPETADLIAWLESTSPALEVVLHDGGQPFWPLIVGVE
jgi:dihydroxyacetone kinase-like predicted kinase